MRPILFDAGGGLSHRHRQHAQKIGKKRLYCSGDILLDRQTDRQTYSSQYFATTPMGEVTILLQQNPSFGEKLDQVRFCCRKLCWKVTKYDVHILWLTVSMYELFECPLYVLCICQVSSIKNLLLLLHSFNCLFVHIITGTLSVHRKLRRIHEIKACSECMSMPCAAVQRWTQRVEIFSGVGITLCVLSAESASNGQ